MNFGFNSKVRVGAAKYLVQSEDHGRAHPFLDTIVYVSGRVVYKRSFDYREFAGATEAGVLTQMLQERLAQQHREVIAELEAGTLLNRGQDKQKAPSVPENAESQDGLEVRLLNPKSWIAAGNAVLEIELSAKNPKQRIGIADVQAYLEQDRVRTPCAQARADAKGRATLKFAVPANVAEGAYLVVRASDGLRYGELRFRLKLKGVDKTPAPVSR